jgi:DNA-binding CsgD family transcriptional regulator
MTEVKPFSNLVGEIYDAALDPSRWTGVLEKICAFVPGAAANIFIQDAISKNANAIFGWGNDPHYERIYLDKYAKINPLFPGLLFWRVGEVSPTSNIVPFARMQRTRFYMEYLRPQGWGDCIAVVLEKSPTSCAIFAVPQHEQLGPIDQRRLDRVRLLAPHVQRAVCISKALDLQKTTADMLIETVNVLSVAVLVVDENARIIHVNRSGLALLSQDDIIRSIGGCLYTADAALNGSLRELLRASFTGDLAAAAKATVFLLSSQNQARYVAHVLPLTVGERRNARSAVAAVAAIFVQKAELNLLAFPELIGRKFRLTPAEIGVVFAIIEAGGVPEVATLLGLSRDTVKTHLRNIFAKTGTKRQADLVRFVAQFANPAAG